MASDAFDSIPPEYREGIDGLVVSREAMTHPTLPDIYTLGHCDTESYPSDWAGPETVRSVVVLYYGSFRSLARKDPGFDWEAEIHETVEHEVMHHLEWLAGRDDLGDVDYALDESYKRGEGLDWDPWYYQRGQPLEGGVYVAEDQIYLEQVWSREAFGKAKAIAFRWKGRMYEIDRPGELGDLHFVWIHDGLVDRPAYLEIVLVRKRSWWEDAKRLLGTSRARVLESEADARLATGTTGGQA